jgi:hypothetical protein
MEDWSENNHSIIKKGNPAKNNGVLKPKLTAVRKNLFAGSADCLYTILNCTTKFNIDNDIYFTEIRGMS